MQRVQEELYNKLIDELSELSKIHHLLFELVKKEKEILISADLSNLQESNKTKEAYLLKIKNLEGSRVKTALSLAQSLGIKSATPRLLEIAEKLDVLSQQELKSLHSTLMMVIQRITEANRENEEYAQSALKTLNGALDNIKSTLSGKPTYQRKGAIKKGPDKAGNFVSKEA